MEICGWWQSPFRYCWSPPRMALLSSVIPQPVAGSTLNTGIRISSRMDGTPRTRTSPWWPPLQKPYYSSSSPGSMAILFLASLAAAANDSRVMMDVPRPVAPATPASAAAPIKRRRLRPPSGASGVSLVRSSVFFIASNSVIGYGGYCFSWLSGALCLAPQDYSAHLYHRDFFRAAGCILTTALAAALNNQRRALVVIEIGHLAIQAVVALHVVDGAIRVDRLYFTLVVTQPARVTALLAALEPVEHTQLGGQRQRGTQRAQIAAVHLAGEDIHHQQQHGVGYKRPATVEMQGDSGFERLHLGHLLSGGHGLQGHTEQHQQDDVLDRPQPLMPDKRHGVLGHFQFTGNFVDQLLQGTERAQPAAVNRTAPEQHDAGNHRPEDEQHRVDQEGFPGKAADQTVHEGQHVHDRQLPQSVPTDEEQGVNQEAVTDPAHHLRLLHQPVLEEQDEQQHQNTGTQHHQLELFLVPHLHPQRLFFQPFLFGQNRLGAGVILVRQLVFQREYREFAVQRAGLALDRQLQGPGSTRVKLVLLPGNKNGHLGKVRHAHGIDIAEAVKVEIPEVEGVTKLADLHPVKDTATNVAGTFEGVLTIGHHRDGMLTFFQF